MIKEMSSPVPMVGSKKPYKTDPIFSACVNQLSEAYAVFVRCIKKVKHTSGGVITFKEGGGSMTVTKDQINAIMTSIGLGIKDLLAYHRYLLTRRRSSRKSDGTTAPCVVEDDVLDFFNRNYNYEAVTVDAAGEFSGTGRNLKNLLFCTQGVCNSAMFTGLREIFCRLNEVPLVRDVAAVNQFGDYFHTFHDEIMALYGDENAPFRTSAFRSPIKGKIHTIPSKFEAYVKLDEGVKALMVRRFGGVAFSGEASYNTFREDLKARVQADGKLISSTNKYLKTQ